MSLSLNCFPSDSCVIIMVLAVERGSKKLFCDLKALGSQKVPSVLLVDRCLKWYLNWGLVVEDETSCSKVCMNYMMKISFYRASNA